MVLGVVCRNCAMRAGETAADEAKRSAHPSSSMVSVHAGTTIAGDAGEPCSASRLGSTPSRMPARAIAWPCGVRLARA
jgi:hypothetical protein